MKNILIIFSSLLIVVTPLWAQEPEVEWVNSIGGVGKEVSHSVITDVSGNIYVAGMYTDSIDIANDGLDLSYCRGSRDIIIEKLDPEGNLLWYKTIGGGGNDVSFSITTDKYGNLYIAGFYELSIDFDNDGVNDIVSKGESDIFVQKLDSSGNNLWLKTMGGVKDDFANSITTDYLGNIYITGNYRGSADFDGDGINELSSKGETDCFVQKLDTDGNSLWVNSMGGTSNETGNSIVTDVKGDIYLVGHYIESADFDNDGSNELSSIGGYDIFIQKLNTEGKSLWVKTIRGIGNDDGKAVTADNYGNIYITGTYHGSADFNEDGINDLTVKFGVGVFVQKLDSSGNSIWVNSIESSKYLTVGSIRNDLNGDLYIVGNFYGILSPNGEGNNDYTSKGEGDIFIQKYDSEGSTLWLKLFGGSNFETGLSIAIDSSNNIYTTGFFVDSTSFDRLGIPSKGGNDIFVLKLSQCRDILPPVAVCADTTLYLNSAAQTTIKVSDIDAGSTDDCGIKSRWLSHSTFDCDDIGKQTIELNILDNKGNSDVCTATITILDTISPEVFCKDYSLSLDSEGNGTLTTNDIYLNSTDNCLMDNIVLDRTHFTCADIGTVEVVVTATDLSNNSSSCLANVIVVDDIAPVIVCPANIIDSTNINCYYTIEDYIYPSMATDGCDPDEVSINQSPLEGEVMYGDDNQSEFIVTFEAKDASGNISTCEMVVNLNCNDDLFIPNVFTPNGDGNFDVFYVDYSGVKPYQIEIYNRWGALVYQSTDPSDGWDGTNSIHGTYYYLITIGDVKYKGWLNVMR